MASILLLEDEETLVKQIGTMLEAEGHNVDSFTSASFAMVFLESNTVDLVIADLFIRSNGKYVQDGGIKLISHIRQVLESAIPIIAISGSFREAHGQHAQSTAETVGASVTLAKPFHPDDLSKLVNEQLV